MVNDADGGLVTLVLSQDLDRLAGAELHGIEEEAGDDLREPYAIPRSHDGQPLL